MRDKEVTFMQIRANANENQVVHVSNAARARLSENSDAHSMKKW